MGDAAVRQHRQIPRDGGLRYRQDAAFGKKPVRFAKAVHPPGRRGGGQIENIFGLLKSELLYSQKFQSMDYFKAELIKHLDFSNR